MFEFLSELIKIHCGDGIAVTECADGLLFEPLAKEL